METYRKDLKSLLMQDDEIATWAGIPVEFAGTPPGFFSRNLNDIRQFLHALFYERRHVYSNIVYYLGGAIAAAGIVGWYFGSKIAGIAGLGLAAVSIALLLLFVFIKQLCVHARHVAFRKENRQLSAVLVEIKEFHKVIKAVGSNDELVGLGNPGMSPEQRNKVIVMLTIVRHEIIHGLETLRILKEDKYVNPPLPKRELSLTTLAVKDAASEDNEYSRLIGQIMVIAVNVREQTAPKTESSTS